VSVTASPGGARCVTRRAVMGKMLIVSRLAGAA
jgi:hypothetical protein